MVGDDFESDVLGSQALGIRGVARADRQVSARGARTRAGKPDEVIDSIADLADLLSCQ